MAKHCHMVYLWIIWHFQTYSVVPFNLDTENVLQKKGDPGSLFGFSVAFHQQLKPARKNLLLVGAPRARHQNQVNVTGVVYKCDLTSASERCQAIEFDGTEFLDSKGINNQWMGVRVTSQGPGKNVMTCANHYQQWSSSPGRLAPILLTGQCYLLGDDLKMGNTEHRRWRRVVCDSSHLQRQRNHEWFAYCQQGHGAAFAKDNVSALFGAPGAYRWKGIVRMEVLDDLDISSEDPRETGNLGEFNQKLIPLHFNSYLDGFILNYPGFSIDSGMALIGKGELTIVSGAPRGGYSGQVAFLKADPVTKGNLSVELVLSGPGLASSFGYDLTVVDLNGDGWEDLAVGAPQFFEKDSTVGGAVYIYINNNGRNWENISSVKLLGQKESMFGLAVENIGDVNQDHYGDIAVGAPYEASGRVYLYYGSSDGVNKKPAQILSSGSKKVALFGYSLTGSLDVDDNQYPDLAVGSQSDSVFVFRARPVVTVSTSLKIAPNEIDITKEQCDVQTCFFAVAACFTYAAHPESFNPKLMLNYTFKADYERKKSSARVKFLGSSQGNLELSGQGRKACIQATLRLLRDIKNKLQSIPVSVTVSLWSSSQTTRTRADQRTITPVLNLYQQKTTASEITLINEGCGSDRICQSKLHLQYKFCSKETQNGQDVFKSLDREDGVAVITPSHEDIALEITVTNRNGDDAHQSHLTIVLPDKVHYSPVNLSATAETQVSCTAKGTLIVCDLGNPLQRDAEVTFYVTLTTSAITLSTKLVKVTLQLETTSNQTIEPIEAFAKVVFELQLQVYGQARPSQVSIGDILKGESEIKYVEQIGNSVQYEFRITNLGRPLNQFTNASLSIYWPKENSVGKWFLYLTHISSEGVQSVPCSPVDEVNPLKHVKNWHYPPRKRREAEHKALSTDGFIFLPTQRKYKTLNCSDGLKCVEIRCPLLGLDSTARVVLHSHLWNTTLAEDYSSLNYLDISVDAILTLTNAPENIGLKPEKLKTKVKLTVFLKTRSEFLVKVAWWIIFLTVISLLLLLAFFGFLLWKYGCTKCFDYEKKRSHDGDTNTETAPLKG